MPSFFVLIGLLRSRGSTMLEKLKGIYFVDPDDTEFKKHNEKCANEVGSATGIRHAVQVATTLSTRNPWRFELQKVENAMGMYR